MVQKDYIVRIIEQLAAFLWTIVFNKRIKNYDIALEKIEEAYNGLLFLSSDKVKNLSADEIIQNNTYKNILNKDNIEIIANLLFEEADVIEKINGSNYISLEYFQKSFVLFNKILEPDNHKKYFYKMNEIIINLNNYEIPNTITFMIYKYFEINGLYGKAEDKLYDLLENNYPDIKNEMKLFYNRLLEKCDTELEKGNLSRNEILEEMKNI
jgi:hypothetical protein